MSVTFENFKQQIDPKILERGRKYFRDGNIDTIEVEDEGIWSAQVMGSEDYDVRIEQLPDGTLECSCTCPYEFGPYCKHVAAVLFGIEDAFPDVAKSHAEKPSTAKRPTKEHLLTQALNDVPREELVATLLDLARQDKRINSQLMLRFGAVKEDKAAYGKIVQDTLRAHKEHGFLDYQGARRAGRDVGELVKRADQLLERGEWESAVSFYQAVMENVAEAIGQADDSDGELGGCMERATEGLSHAAGVANPAQRSAFFVRCLEEAQGDRYAGWDWRWDLYRLAADLVRTPQEREQLFSALDKYQVKPEARQSFSRHEGMYLRDDFMSRFDAERAAMLKLSVIEREDGEQAAEKFIADHVDLDRFRHEMIQRLMKRGDLAAAKQLAADAVATNVSLGLPGLVSQYRHLLLEIAEREKDTQSVIVLARELLLEGQESPYYDLLKANVPEAQWPEFVRALIKDAQAKRFLGSLINRIYAREGMWQEILTQAKPTWSAEIEHYRKDLEKRFPDEVAAIYERTVYKALEQATGRDSYQSACEYMRRMKKLGKTARVDTMVSDFKRLYPKRRALLEELAKV